MSVSKQRALLHKILDNPTSNNILRAQLECRTNGDLRTHTILRLNSNNKELLKASVRTMLFNTARVL